MNIRKFIFTSIIVISFFLFLFTVAYQNYFSNNLNTKSDLFSDYARIVKTDGREIQVYQENQWEKLRIKGIELSAFYPGYEKYQTDVEKETVLEWLEEIGALNVNLIKIPYIQPPNFYTAIYEYNLNHENPIYLMHEVMLDEQRILDKYDAFDEKILKRVKKDIKKTIDVMNGQALLINNDRSHRGLYLKDLSKYHLGLIIGTNVNSEIVTLTNARYREKTTYQGDYFTVEQGNAFEVFMGEVLDYAAKYERVRYARSSLYSFLTTVETDPFEYEQESNLTKHASINLEKLQPTGENNLFVSYQYYPGSSAFLEYESIASEVNVEKIAEKSLTSEYLEKINQFYQTPLIVSDIGISSSRGKSKVDQLNGFHRGGFTEQEQGERLVALLEDAYQTDLAGVIVNAWQDDWAELTSYYLTEDYLDQNSSSYWPDLQSSDESFGLLKFEPGMSEKKVYLDGKFAEWEEVKPLLLEGDIQLKIQSDLSHLYLLVEKENWSLNNDQLSIGVDITDFSGSNKWANKSTFSNEADFIIQLEGYNESRIVVNNRYNLFNYLHKYYANLIDKEVTIPTTDSNQFSAIYLLNRKEFYFQNTGEIISPVYYETGKLVHGVDHPDSEAFNSQADFYKEGNRTEIKIPWSLLNITDPIKKEAYGDFYLEGLAKKQALKEIGFSINYQNQSENIVTDNATYSLERLKPTTYFSRKKASYKQLQKYWQENPK